MIIQPQIVDQAHYGYELPFTLVDGDENAVDITSAVLTINVQDIEHTLSERGYPHEAVARGLTALKRIHGLNDLCEGSVQVMVQDTPVEHTVPLIEI